MPNPILSGVWRLPGLSSSQRNLSGRYLVGPLFFCHYRLNLGEDNDPPNFATQMSVATRGRPKQRAGFSLSPPPPLTLFLVLFGQGLQKKSSVCYVCLPSDLYVGVLRDFHGLCVSERMLLFRMHCTLYRFFPACINVIFLSRKYMLHFVHTIFSQPATLTRVRCVAVDG